MSLYLQSRCGDIQWLIEVGHVMEVLDLSETAMQSHKANSLTGHFNWREQLIPLLNMPCFLGLEAMVARRIVVIDSGLQDGALRYIALAIEKSDSLLSLDADDLADMAEQHDQLLDVFEAVYPPTDSSSCQLILRFPTDWITTALSGAEVV